MHPNTRPDDEPHADEDVEDDVEAIAELMVREASDSPDVTETLGPPPRVTPPVDEERLDAGVSKRLGVEPPREAGEERA